MNIANINWDAICTPSALYGKEWTYLRGEAWKKDFLDEVEKYNSMGKAPYHVTPVDTGFRSDNVFVVSRIWNLVLKQAELLYENGYDDLGEIWMDDAVGLESYMDTFED